MLRQLASEGRVSRTAGGKWRLTAAAQATSTAQDEPEPAGAAGQPDAGGGEGPPAW